MDFPPGSRVAAATLALMLAMFATGAHAEEPRGLRVFAAISLTEVLQDIAADYAGSGALRPEFSFAASSALARQVEAGAPADIFISADAEWMDYLEARDLLRPGTRRDIAGNRLVLIAPSGSEMALQLSRGADIAGMLAGGRLASGDPDSVPAGRYARSALMYLGIWPALSDRLARAENVRVALAWVARGEAPLGIVYATDALSETRVRVVDTFDTETHPPIRYPAAALRGAPREADDFIRFLGETNARARLHKRGFELPPPRTESVP